MVQVILSYPPWAQLATWLFSSQFIAVNEYWQWQPKPTSVRYSSWVYKGIVGIQAGSCLQEDFDHLLTIFGRPSISARPKSFATVQGNTSPHSLDTSGCLALETAPGGNISLPKPSWLTTTTYSWVFRVIPTQPSWIMDLECWKWRPYKVWDA